MKTLQIIPTEVREAPIITATLGPYTVITELATGTKIGKTSNNLDRDARL